MSLHGDLVTRINYFESLNNEYKKIKNPDNVVATSGISKEHERYSKSPHVSYEFKIPIDLIGRSDVYNVHTTVFDGEKDQSVT